MGKNGMYRKQLRSMEAMLLNSVELSCILLRICIGLDEEEGKEIVLEEVIKNILSLQE